MQRAINEEIDIDVDEIEFDSDDEIQPLSDDSACNTDDEENVIETQSCKTLDLPSLSAIHPRTRFCASYFYYSDDEGYNACTACLMLLRDVFDKPIIKIKKHVVGSYDSLNGTWCSNCRAATFIIYSCDMCPECTRV